MANITFSIQCQFRVVIYPAPDLEGQWIAHCLETDIVSQGDSVDHAFEMMIEAVNSIVQYNLGHGRPPLNLTPAPKEVWDLVGISQATGISANIKVSTRKMKQKEPMLPDIYPLYAYVSQHAPQQPDAG
ncbi:MAG: hypothetical protein ABIJ56_03055 [Pseudomonadota bacterium]